MTNTHITTISILGKGNVGLALAAAWRREGFQVLFGVRNPEAPDERTHRAATEAGDVVVLAVPYGAVEAVLTDAGPCAGKIVIDCTNPLTMTPSGLALAVGFTTSGAEDIARKLPQARIVKTLNQTGAENMQHAKAFAYQPCMFVAGDDVDAKATARDLVEKIGFSVLDAGPLKNARLLEPLAMLWIDQAFQRGAGRDSTFGWLTRTANPNT